MMTPTAQHIHAFLKYFEAELPKLKTSYKWSIPSINGFSTGKLNSYEDNVKLKQFLHQKLLAATTLDEKLEVAQLIIIKWGQVKGNNVETLKRYVSELDNKQRQTPLKGVASYSKLYAIWDPDNYAIYDARVAACINAMQWNQGIKGLVFPYVPGRNNVTGNVLKKVGFSQDTHFKSKNLASEGWKLVPKDEAYSLYISTLKSCLIHFEGYRLHDLEMVLFSNAEVECQKAIDSTKVTLAA